MYVNCITGTYNELISDKKCAFSQFIKTHLATQSLASKVAEVKTDVPNNNNNNENLVQTSVKTTSGPAEKLIVKENVESGGVKLKIVFEYLKACRLWLTGFFLLLKLLSYASNVASNFWLSDWANEARANPELALESKFFRLGIYALLSFLDRK